MNIKEISAIKANELLEKGALLVDVRELDEAQQTSFQVEGIENIPFSTFDDNYYNLPKNRIIVLACHLGIRSLRADQFLVIQGWNEANMYSLEGGIDAWKRAELPIKKAARSFTVTKPASSCGCGSNGCC